MEWIDFRSDTVTKPTKEMQEAMCKARVGDDVFAEDPSINELEEKAAGIFRMESALFCPSGTMTNQIAIKVHTQPGDEVVCDQNSHVYQYEGGGIAYNSGASVRLLIGNRGRITAQQVSESVNPDDVHKAHTSLVVLENTSNKGGGSCYEINDIQEIKNICLKNNLSLHLDGARLFNALIYKNQLAGDYGKIFDSISICLSKGLGCPVGSVLIGKKEFMKRARRVRKVMGGGMRQAGSLAAAGIYALDNHVNRLATDHQHAKQLEEALKNHSKIESVMPVETNIILFTVKNSISAVDFTEKLKEKGILCFITGHQQIRWVTHLDISPAMINRTLEILKHL
jgi:threonine aldolase